MFNNKLLTRLFIFFTAVTLITFVSCDSDDNGGTAPQTGGLTASPSSLTIEEGNNASATISGGETNAVYNDSSFNTNIATSQLTGTTLTVYAQSEGSTTIKVTEEGTDKYVNVGVTVTTGGTTGNTELTFTVSGDTSFTFTANNELDTSLTEMNGTGFVDYSFGSSMSGQIIGYEKVDSTRGHTISIMLSPADDTYEGNYTILAGDTTASSGDEATVFFFTSADLDSEDHNEGYFMYTGNVVVSSYDGSVISGTFSGTGYYANESGPDLNRTVTISNGSFNVPKVPFTNP